MKPYRILLIIEEKVDNDCAEELIDFTRTLGYTNDLDLANALIEALLAPARAKANELGISLKRNAYESEEDYDT